MVNAQGSLIDLQILLGFDSNYCFVCPVTYKLLFCFVLNNNSDRSYSRFKKSPEKFISIVKIKRIVGVVSLKLELYKEQKIATQGGLTNNAFLEQIQIKIKQGQLSEAISDCNWLLQLDPHNPQAYYHRGKIELQLGKYQEAKTDLRQAAEYFRSQGNIVEFEKTERLCLQLHLTNTISASTLPLISQLNFPQFTRLSQPENAIQNRLCLLVGDWNIAQDPVERSKTSYPGKSETWYWEKAIRDLESDRF